MAAVRLCVFRLSPLTASFSAAILVYHVKVKVVEISNTGKHHEPQFPKTSIYRQYNR